MLAIIPGMTPGTGTIHGTIPDGTRLGLIAMGIMATMVTIVPGITVTMAITDRVGMEEPTAMSHAPFAAQPTRADARLAVVVPPTVIADRLAPLARLALRMVVAAVEVASEAVAASDAVADARHLADDRSEDGDSSLDLKVISAPRSMRQLIV